MVWKIRPYAIFYLHYPSVSAILFASGAVTTNEPARFLDYATVIIDGQSKRTGPAVLNLPDINGDVCLQHKQTCI